MQHLNLAFIENANDFPPISQALIEPNGLLGIGQKLSSQLLIGAYSRGVFPWFNAGEPVLWWSPDPRACFYPNEFKPSSSLKKLINQQKYTVSLNYSFQSVIQKCAEVSSNRKETWINTPMIEAYLQLHKEGLAHSIEVWNRNNELVGGLYGVSLGQLFFGESMFYREPNTSKIALGYLINHCQHAQFPIIDCQMPNPHLMSLGAKKLSRIEFLDYLNSYKDKKIPEDMWSPKWLNY